MQTQEKRAFRREIINFALHEIYFGRVLSVLFNPNSKLSFIKSFVREYELNHS